MNDTSDNSLVRQAVSGDSDAFAALLERHYDRIYRVSVRMLGKADEAEDLAQEVCMVLPAKLASYRGESRFTTWLYRVVVNASHDVLRRKAARQRVERDYAESNSLARTVNDADMSESPWLRQALGHLSEELRITVFLVVEEGLRHAEAGEALGISESTVSWRMHEVRKRLRAITADEEAI